MTLVSRHLDFTLPDTSIATEPAEIRGKGRDDVRLMVTRRSSGSVVHESFRHLDRHLSPGDVVVVNTSATIPAAIDARTENGAHLKLHIASPASGGLWSVEVRTVTDGGGTAPGPDLEPQTLRAPGNALVHLRTRSPRTPRLWVAAVDGVTDLSHYLEVHGEPIRYVAGPRRPISAYQTIFALQPGSVEMPSAGRPFTAELLARLVARGIVVVPIVLHAGVSSYEEDESPGEEQYEVTESTATVVNALRAAGGRVVAVGTTVVRALESAADEYGDVHPGHGLTDLIVTPERGVRVVDSLLTGWHEPRSSHLTMLEAFIPRDHLRAVYDEAIAGGYFWHEFGDELLVLP